MDCDRDRLVSTFLLLSLDFLLVLLSSLFSPGAVRSIVSNRVPSEQMLSFDPSLSTVYVPVCMYLTSQIIGDNDFLNN